MSFEADFMMRKLRQLPVAQALAKPTQPLPTARAPSLDGLVLTVKHPEAPTPEAVSQRLQELLRDHGTRRARVTGEKIGRGDELWVDLICSAGGALLQSGIKTDYPLDVIDDPMFEGLAQALLGATVGASVTCAAVLGPIHPDVSKRGARVEVLVDIHRAFEVSALDAKKAEQLAKLGRGATLDAVMKSISGELAEEAEAAAWAEASRELLAVVAERGGATVSESLVDEELRRAWGVAEGSKLSAKGFGADEQQRALKLWLENPKARTEVRSRLQLALALKEVALRDNVTPDPERIEQLMVAMVAPYGLDSAGLANLAATEPSVVQALADAAFEQQLIGHVLSRAEVRHD